MKETDGRHGSLNLSGRGGSAKGKGEGYKVAYKETNFFG